MLKFIGLSLCALLCGCAHLGVNADSNYAKYAEAKRAFTETERARAAEESKVVMNAVSLIITAFKAVAGQAEASPVFQKVVETSVPAECLEDPCTDLADSKKVVTETVYDTSGPLISLLVAQQQTEAIKFILPVIRDIYKQQQLNISAPTTAADVAAAFVEQIPFMTTVAGMYSLGSKGLEAAGTRILEYSQPSSNTTTTITNNTVEN